MIHLNQIEKSFGPQRLLDGIDWQIKPRQRVGLIGPNGAGKTTLMRIIAGAMAPDGGEISFGKGVTFGYLPQEIAELRGISVWDEAKQGLRAVFEISEAMRGCEAALASTPPDEVEALMARYAQLQARFEALDGFRAESRIAEVLTGLGFPPALHHVDCGTLSGGWQMRVALARLLLQSPNVLLLDEPTNHLDLHSLLWLEGFLKGFEGGLIFISHDRAFLNRLASHIAELAAGQLRLYTGDFEAYLQQSELRRAQLEKQAVGQRKRAGELERFISRFRYKASKARQVQSRVKMLEKMDRVELEQDTASIHFELGEPPKSGRVVMALEHVRQGYGDRIIYEDLNVELLRGRKIALVGPNGAGKSTLLKILAGVLPVLGGRRELGFQAKLYYFAQHQIDILNVDQTVFEEVAEVANRTPTQVRSLLGAFLFSGADADKPIRVLSGGEKNRVALAKMLLTPANLLLLDEPTNHLDMGSRAVLEEALRAYTGAVVLISHDRHFIDGVCDEIWEVEGGEVRRYLGGFTAYQEKKAAEAAEAAEVAEAAARRGVAQAASVEGRRENRKDEKRRAAEQRAALAARTQGVRRTLDALEAEIAALEARQEAIQALQLDPSLYDDPARAGEVNREAAAVEASLLEKLEAWEAAGEQLEALRATPA
ncbi:ABC-F family ATP-binding cassette domain-containing protein [Myxococcota bacterium]|nr:ABC-F family ATP-binding cassette domain-containing protein [Myxococcota bacterium]